MRSPLKVPQTGEVAQLVSKHENDFHTFSCCQVLETLLAHSAGAFAREARTPPPCKLRAAVAGCPYKKMQVMIFCRKHVACVAVQRLQLTPPLPVAKEHVLWSPHCTTPYTMLQVGVSDWHIACTACHLSADFAASAAWCSIWKGAPESMLLLLSYRLQRPVHIETWDVHAKQPSPTQAAAQCGGIALSLQL